MMLPSKKTAVAVSALAVLGLAACGGGEDPAVEDVTPSAPEETTPSDESSGEATPTPDGEATAQATAAEGERAQDKRVRFRRPNDGQTVTSPVRVVMRAPGLKVEEAGEVREGAGHFHLMIDTPCIAPGETIPEDEAHRHFGDGSKRTEIELENGEHTLCLQFGDGEHTALDYTEEITITVADEAPSPEGD